MSLQLSTLIHISAVAVFGYAFYYYNYHVDFPSGKGKEYLTAPPGKWKFLTVWDLTLQLIYFSVSLINDVAGSSEVNTKKQTGLQRIRDTMFACWTFPTGVFVSLSFWILFGINRSMVFPIWMDGFYPLWLNHAVHTGPILFLVAESYFTFKIYPSKVVGIAGNLTFYSSYAAWTVYWNQYTGVWPYPILATLNNTQRTIFIGTSGLAIFALYFLGEAIYQWRWGKKTETIGHTPKGKSVNKVKRKTK